MPDLNEMAQQIANLDRRVVGLEAIRDDGAPGPRVRLYVSEVITPIQKSVDKIESAITKLADGEARRDKEVEGFYAAHKAALDKEQARREAEEREKQLVPTLKRWGAVAAAVGAIWFVFRIVGTVLEVYIQTRAGK